MKDIKQIEALLEKFLEGKTSLEEEQWLRDYFANETIPEELESFRSEFEYYEQHQQLIADKESLGQLLQDDKTPQVWTVWRVAAVFAMVIGSFILGYSLNVKSSLENKLVDLESEVNDLKEATVLAMLQINISHKKIEGIVLASQLSSPSEQLIKNILFEFENNESPIVQNIALEFLYTQIQDEQVQNTLLKSLTSNRISPTQLEIFENLSRSDDQKILRTLQELIESDSLDDETKSQLQEILWKKTKAS